MSASHTVCIRMDSRPLLTSDPIHGDAFHAADPRGDDILPPGLVTLGSGNPVQTHVGPVHRVISCGTGRAHWSGKREENEVTMKARTLTHTHALAQTVLSLEHTVLWELQCFTAERSISPNGAKRWL